MTSIAFRFPSQPIGQRRPVASRLWATFADAWKTWRADTDLRAQRRALARLDRRTLVDVGLGEFASPAGPSWADLETARW